MHQHSSVHTRHAHARASTEAIRTDIAQQKRVATIEWHLKRFDDAMRRAETWYWTHAAPREHDENDEHRQAPPLQYLSSHTLCSSYPRFPPCRSSTDSSISGDDMSEDDGYSSSSSMPPAPESPHLHSIYDANLMDGTDAPSDDACTDDNHCDDHPQDDNRDDSYRDDDSQNTSQDDYRDECYRDGYEDGMCDGCYDAGYDDGYQDAYGSDTDYDDGYQNAYGSDGYNSDAYRSDGYDGYGSGSDG